MQHKKTQSNNFNEVVWAAAKSVPRGKVATYTMVAYLIGKPGAARAVGNALGKNRSLLVPCHRVVRADGSIGGYAWGSPKKVKLLKKEGVTFRNGKVEKKCFLLRTV